MSKTTKRKVSKLQIPHAPFKVRRLADVVVRRLGKNKSEAYRRKIRVDVEAALGSLFLDEIHLVWSIDDILTLDSTYTLTRAQARNVLARLELNHDSEKGINWDVIARAIRVELEENT